MAKIPSGILGRVRGKIGDVVGASWKGIPYLRQYVVPANPNTTLQQTQRELFSDLVSLAKAALGPVLQVFWDPFLKSNSGWAHFIGLNRHLYAAHLDFSTVHLAEGTLEGDTMSSATYAAGDVSVIFSGTPHGNGQATDVAVLFVYDEVNKVGWCDTTSHRSDNAAVVTVGTGRTASNLNCWLFFTDSATAPTKVSFSNFRICS